MANTTPTSEPVGRFSGCFGQEEGTGLVDLWEPARTPNEIKLGTSFGYGHEHPEEVPVKANA